MYRRTVWGIIAGILFSGGMLLAAVISGENNTTVYIPANWNDAGVLDYGWGSSDIVIPDIDEFAVITSINVYASINNVQTLADIDILRLRKGSLTYNFIPIQYINDENGLATFNGANPAGTWTLELHDQWAWWDWDSDSEENSYSRINHWEITIYYVIEQQPPGDPTDPDPADLAGDVTIYTDFAWGDAPRAADYDIAIWQQGSPEPGPESAGFLGTSYAPILPLQPSKDYYWRVTANNSEGSEAGPLWSFTTNDGSPDTPVYATPPNAAVWVSVTPEFSWSTALGAASYDIYLWEGSTVPVVPTSSDTGTTYSVGTDLSSDTAYSWKVVATNGYGSTEGPTWTFTTLKTYADWIDDYYVDAADQDPAADPDGDGATNQQEYSYPSDPTLADTDGDGHTDGYEIDNDYDPNDPNDPPDAYFSGGTKSGCLPGAGVFSGVVFTMLAAAWLGARRRV